jgi:hypothetical protein
MADGAGLDQRRNDSSAKRAGAASDNDMTIVKIHVSRVHLNGLWGIIANPEIDARWIRPTSKI